MILCLLHRALTINNAVRLHRIASLNGDSQYGRDNHYDMMSFIAIIYMAIICMALGLLL